MKETEAKSPNQVRAIFAEARRIGLDDEALRDLVESATRRTRSISALTHKEAEVVIRKLKGNSFVPLRTLQYRRQKQGVEQVVQPAQLKLIAELASQRNWSAETLIKFCRRQCGYTRPRTTNQANKIIEGIKAMNRREGLWAN
jgi:hypothetical protein